MKILIGFQEQEGFSFVRRYLNLGGREEKYLLAEPGPFYAENIFMGFAFRDGASKLTARLWGGVGSEFGFCLVEPECFCKVEG